MNSLMSDAGWGWGLLGLGTTYYRNCYACNRKDTRHALEFILGTLHNDRDLLDVDLVDSLAKAVPLPAEWLYPTSCSSSVPTSVLTLGL
jgi:hypothetical protein